MAVSYDLRVGDALSLDGGRIVITLKEKSGRAAKVNVDADATVTVAKIKSAAPAAVQAQMGVIRPR
jgi:hypothetical protein